MEDFGINEMLEMQKELQDKYKDIFSRSDHDKNSI